jgi:hypothetical protein
MTPATPERPLIPIRFEWQEDRRAAPPLDPNVVGRTLLAVAAADRDHEITPFGVVEASKAPDAPLHGYFEWNDKIAASLHREEEARRMIKRLVVVRVDPETEDELPPAPAFAAVVEDDTFDSYAPTTGERAARPKGRPRAVATEAPPPPPQHAEQLARQALWSLVALRKRYQSLPQFAEVFEAIDRVHKDLGMQVPS